MNALAKGTRMSLKSKPLPADVRRQKRKQLKRVTPHRVRKAMRKYMQLVSDSDDSEDELFF